MGVDALDRGDFVEIDDADLEQCLERLPAVTSTIGGEVVRP